jgi:pyruvate kinase
VRKTKIVCTLGPASNTGKAVAGLKKAGMNVARLNFSHGTPKEKMEAAELVREARGKDALAILLDLPGHKVRVGTLKSKQVVLKDGSRVKVTSRETVGDETVIPLNCINAAALAEKGDRVFFDDGKIELKVEKAEGESLHCKVVVGGPLSTRKGFNSPKVDDCVDCVTPRDREGIKLAKKMKPDFVAQSFVRNAGDLKKMRSLIPKGISLVAKIESLQAVQNLDEILRACDAVMVARGDLGMQAPIQDLPILQKTIIAKARAAGKPVITATQMMESMMEHPWPTRAEATDVANAFFDGTDAVMLSGETAVGRDPVRAVRVMSRILEAAEKRPEFITPNPEKPSLKLALSLAVSKLARDAGAKAIITYTDNGRTARLVARERPTQPVIAVTEYGPLYQKLSLLWGSAPLLVHPGSVKELEAKALAYARKVAGLKKGDRVVSASGRLNSTQSNNMFKIESV